jgi:putative Mg2+ transporter-C (MgtC) family protein
LQRRIEIAPSDIIRGKATGFPYLLATPQPRAGVTIGRAVVRSESMGGSEVVFALVKPAVGLGEVAGRLLLAAVLGGLIGLEREATGQPAGLRTHLTVGLGAALFGVISVHGFDAYVQPRADSNYQIDVTRVASQVVVGIGFLGAGAILKEGAQIHGLTTAASLWVTAAVGLALGIGNFFAAGFATVVLLAALIGLRAPRRWIRRRTGRAKDFVIVRLPRDADPGAVMSAITALEGVEVRSMSVARESDGVTLEVFAHSSVGVELATRFASIASRDDVKGVEIA